MDLTQFGDGKAGKALRVIASIRFIVYFLKGAGKFMTIIFPWDMTIQIGDYKNFTLASIP